MVAGGHGKVVEPCDLACGEDDGVGAHVLLDPGGALGTGNGAMSSSLASSQARATCAGVAAASAAIAWTSSAMRRLRSKFSPVKRGLVLRQSLSARSSMDRIVPVRNP
jgi:hypothetical protein